ncbi:MAG: hypothetical protein CVU61_06585 [Deltaproteobacteria bacterium HGW-Deltaproteobacteria-19]|jgi:hypothetical protein|nr:MAG: hypothetical protein CVU61_06585 [Deltaproteobacteria bacterium HGW-Deltaproteobacteria-19]
MEIPEKNNMPWRRWIFGSVGLAILVVALFAAFNLYADTYGIRWTYTGLILRGEDPAVVRTGMELNQHLYKPAYVLAHPGRFDSFLFGSSRAGLIDVRRITAGNFYNMNYAAGLPAEHLDILKVFLAKGIPVRNVVVALDEFSFQIRPDDHKDQLLRIPHPLVTGDSTLTLFGRYFLRVPEGFEVTDTVRKIIGKKGARAFEMDNRGTISSWRARDEQIGRDPEGYRRSPVFQEDSPPYAGVYIPETIAVLREMADLSRKYKFRLILFVNPIHWRVYLNHADTLRAFKRELVKVVPFYDFSGLNPVTTDNLNYYETSHYRYGIGDRIVERIFQEGAARTEGQFGRYVTADNVEEILARERDETARFPASHPEAQGSAVQPQKQDPQRPEAP